MKKVLPTAAAALVCGLGSVASAAELYNETFSTDGPLSSYVGAGKVFVRADNSTPMPGVSGGKLGIGYMTSENINSGGAASSLGGAQPLVSLRMDVTPQSYSNGRFYMIAGDSDWMEWVGWGVDGRNWAQFRIDESGLSIQGRAAVPFAMQTTHTMSVFLNNSGASQSYTGPDGTTYTVADQTWSLFDGSALLAQNVAKGTGVASISHVGMLVDRNWNGAQTLTDVDNFIVRSDLLLPAVPEPATLGLLAVSGMLFMRRRPA